MGQRWIATIRTQSNILQNIEIDTPGIVRQDAIAQIKSTYGAKEVVTCNPISSSSSSSSGSYSGGSSDGSWFWVLLFGAMIAVYVFRYIIIAAVVLIALYYLYKWFKK
jgi:K+-transporting ATPase A subunit